LEINRQLQVSAALSLQKEPNFPADRNLVDHTASLETIKGEKLLPLVVCYVIIIAITIIIGLIIIIVIIMSSMRGLRD
jgi:hypothetical protein